MLRTVFRLEMPLVIRMQVLGYCSYRDFLHVSEVSRSFRSWGRPDGRQVLQTLCDRTLRGGVEAARRLARVVHPRFLRHVRVEVHGEVACAFLTELLSSSAGLGALTSLEDVAVSCRRYSQASLLIELLKSKTVHTVRMLTRLDRPLPRECLMNVQQLGLLALHSTQLSGFPSLFAGGAAAALREVHLLDTRQLNLEALLGAMPCPSLVTGEHVRKLSISPCEDADLSKNRHWTRWIQPLAELLQHPLLASLEEISVPFPSEISTAVECAQTIFDELSVWGVPQRLVALRFRPYQSWGVSGLGSFDPYPTEDRARLAALLLRFRSAFPNLTVE